MKMNRYALKYNYLGLFLGIVILFSASFAQADSLSVAISDGAYLLNADSTQGRLLLKFEMPDELSGAEIVFAELLVPLTAAIPDSSALAVQCSPLLISWVPAELAWNDLGDNLSEEIITEPSTQYATATEGVQEAYFDITQIVKAWQDSALENRGLLLSYDATSLPYFTYAGGEGVPFGVVRFEYTH
jgi:hypothetical protein